MNLNPEGSWWKEGSVVLALPPKRTTLECFFFSFSRSLFLNLHSCSHPQNLILKLENTVSQLVILEGGGGERRKRWRLSGKPTWEEG